MQSTQETPARHIAYGALALGLGILGLAHKGVFFRLLFDLGLTPAEVVSVRWAAGYPVAVVLLFLSVPRGQRRFPARRELRGVAVTSALALVTMALHTVAFQHLSVGLASVLFSVYIVFLVAARMLNTRQVPPLGQVLGLFALTAGLILLVDRVHGVRGGLGVGLFTCGLSAALWAFYLVRTERFTRGEHGGAAVHPLLFVVWTQAPAALFGLLFLGAEGGLPSAVLTGRGAVVVVGMVVFSTLIPVALTAEGIRRLGAIRSAFVSAGAPAVNMVVAWLWLGESLTAVQGMGMLVVTAALVPGGVWRRAWPRTRLLPWRSAA